MDDDDLPPSLDSLADQVAGVQSASSGTERIATVTPATVSAKPSPSSSFGPTAPGGVKKECSKASGGFKKGFFDAKPVKKVAPAAAAGASEASSIPYLRAGGSGSSALPSSSARPSDHIHVKAGQPGKAIPEFLRVEPDAMGLQSAEAKKKIVEAMKPTEQLLGKITSNPKLLTGFDDPEVMKAVAEVAENPAAFSKYKDNKKVLAFYQSMAGIVGDRLTELGDQQEKKGGGGKPVAPPTMSAAPPKKSAPPPPSNVPASFILDGQPAAPPKKKGIIIEEIS